MLRIAAALVAILGTPNNGSVTELQGQPRLLVAVDAEDIRDRVSGHHGLRVHHITVHWDHRIASRDLPLALPAFEGDAAGRHGV